MVLGSGIGSASAVALADAADATEAPEVVLADAEESAEAALVAGTGAGIDKPQSCCLDIIKQLRVPP